MGRTNLPFSPSSEAVRCSGVLFEAIPPRLLDVFEFLGPDLDEIETERSLYLRKLDISCCESSDTSAVVPPPRTEDGFHTPCEAVVRLLALLALGVSPLFLSCRVTHPRGYGGMRI